MSSITAIPKAIARGAVALVRACAAHPKVLVASWSVILLLLTGGVGMVWWQDRDHDEIGRARVAAADAARQRTTDVLSYGFRTLDADLRRAQADLTGQFRDEFTRLTKTFIAPAAKKSQISTKAKISSSGVINASTDKVTVLLFVNQTTRSKKLDKPKHDGSRLRVTMRQVDGDWLIANLKPV